MTIPIAVHAKNLGPIALSDFVGARAIEMKLNPGWWVVFGRVGMVNMDGDTQNAHALLRAERGYRVLDKWVGRLGSGWPSILALQASVVVDPNNSDVIDIECTTYRGFAFTGSLIAIQVNGITEGQG